MKNRVSFIILQFALLLFIGCVDYKEKYEYALDENSRLENKIEDLESEIEAMQTEIDEKTEQLEEMENENEELKNILEEADIEY